VPGVPDGDCRPVDQVRHWHEHTIEQQCVCPGKEQDRIRHIGTKSRSNNANRQYILDPCRSRITLPVRISSDPLKGARSPENGGEQVADDKVLNPSASPAVYRPASCRLAARSANAGWQISV
jgi:hypothetical protein